MIKKMFVLLLMFVYAHITYAGDWSVDSSSKCKAWNPYPQPNEAIKWSGDCLDGYAHGQGTMQWYLNGELVDVYVGNYAKGLMNGEGKFTWANGTSYNGEYYLGERNGFGVMTLTQSDANLLSYTTRGLGTWVGDTYKVIGLWRGNDFHTICASKEECMNQQPTPQTQDVPASAPSTPVSK